MIRTWRDLRSKLSWITVAEDSGPGSLLKSPLEARGYLRIFGGPHGQSSPKSAAPNAEQTLTHPFGDAPFVLIPVSVSSIPVAECILWPVLSRRCLSSQVRLTGDPETLCLLCDRSPPVDGQMLFDSGWSISYLFFWFLFFAKVHICFLISSSR